MLPSIKATLPRLGLWLLAGALCCPPALLAQELRAPETEVTDLDEPGQALHRLAEPASVSTVREAATDLDEPGRARAANPLLDLGVRAVQDVSDRDEDQGLAAPAPWAGLYDAPAEELDNGRGDGPLPRLSLMAVPTAGPLSADELDNGRGDGPPPRLGLTAAPLHPDELDNGRSAADLARRVAVLEADAETADGTGGTGAALAEEADEAELPDGLMLASNYPNPFNPSTEITFTVHEAGHASLHVYDVTGREVAQLFDGAATAGQVYRATFAGGELASGVYLYRLTINGLAVQKKMLLAK